MAEDRGILVPFPRVTSDAGADAPSPAPMVAALAVSEEMARLLASTQKSVIGLEGIARDVDAIAASAVAQRAPVSSSGKVGGEVARLANQPQGPHNSGGGGPPNMELSERVTRLETEFGHLATKADVEQSFNKTLIALVAIMSVAVGVFIYYGDKSSAGLQSAIMADIAPQIVAVNGRIDVLDQKLVQLSDSQKEQGKQLDDIQATIGDIARKLEK